MPVVRRERGASAIEYGLILTAIALVITAAVFGLGPVVADAFERGQCALDEPTAATQC